MTFSIKDPDRCLNYCFWVVAYVQITLLVQTDKLKLSFHMADRLIYTINHEPLSGISLKLAYLSSPFGNLAASNYETHITTNASVFQHQSL